MTTLATLYARFRIRSLRVKMSTGAGVSPNSFTYGFIDDNSSEGGSGESPTSDLGIGQLRRNQLQVGTVPSFLTWSPMDSEKWYYCVPSGEVRLSVPATFVVNSPQAGLLYRIEYTIEFEGAVAGN